LRHRTSAKLLHGESWLKRKTPFRFSGSFTTEIRVL
jgi:hypothetical protein